MTDAIAGEAFTPFLSGVTQLLWAVIEMDWTVPMNSGEKFAAWQRARLHLIVSQIAPTVLLITTVGLLQWGLAETGLATRLAALGILLASGILGALVQFQSATEAQHLANDLKGGEYEHAVAGSAGWLWVPKFLTPAIFVGIYLALVVALLF